MGKKFVKILVVNPKDSRYCCNFTLIRAPLRVKENTVAFIIHVLRYFNPLHQAQFCRRAPGRQYAAKYAFTPLFSGERVYRA